LQAGREGERGRWLDRHLRMITPLGP
jgi:hypothetical protein